MTSRSAFDLGVAVFGLACAGCASRAIPFEQGSNRYTFDIALDALTGEASAFRCDATVRDLTAHRSIAAPAAEGRPGSPGRAFRDDEVSGARLDVELVVDPAARLATCSATVRKDGGLIASDRATRTVP